MAPPRGMHWLGGSATLFSTCCDEEVEGLLRVRHDELELREPVLVRLDVVAVLHFVEAIRPLLLVFLGLAVVASARAASTLRA